MGGCVNVAGVTDGEWAAGEDVGTCRGTAIGAGVGEPGNALQAHAAARRVV